MKAASNQAMLAAVAAFIWTAVLPAFSQPAVALEPLPAGKSKLTLTVRGVVLDVFTYRPASYRDGPLLIVMHGLSRNADGYRDYAVTLADHLHALVAAPCFPKRRFPTETYQRGGVLREGKPQPRTQWTFHYVHDIAAQVRQREGRPEMPLCLIGHSAGGQILDRMAAFLPGDVQRIVAANPGSLLFPTREQNYPFGFGGLPEDWSSDEQIKAYLAAPLTLYLGTEDVLDKDLDQSPEAGRQGGTRFQRGHACFDMARALAQERGWPFHWSLVEAPDVGHSARAMFADPHAWGLFSPASDKARR